MRTKAIMKKKLLTSLLLAMLATAMAWADGEPRSMKYFSFRQGGGMRIELSFHYELNRDKEGKGFLTMTGDCWHEEITIPVGEEVFQEVARIVLENGLDKAIGFYKPEMIIHDAPSLSFSGRFLDGKSFNGSGDIPREFSKGVRILKEYFDKLRGDIKAPGHLDTSYERPDFKDMWLFNGIEVVDGSDAPDELIDIANDYIGNENPAPPSQFSITTVLDGSRTYIAVENPSCDYSETYFLIKPEWERHLIDREELIRYLAGTYHGSDGKTYIFTYDGKYKSSPNAAPATLAFRETDDDICSNIKIGQTWYNFHVTDHGLRLCPSKRIKAMEYECVGKPIELTIDEEEGAKGRWKFTSDVVIDRGMLSYVPKKVVRKMIDELLARCGFKPSDENIEELKTRSWYKDKSTYERETFTDTERLNIKMMESAYKFRDEEKTDDDYPLYEE